jgi:hypothetical protein
MEMVTADELANEKEYQEIVEDIESECKKYGEVKSIVVPRPLPGQTVVGVGKVFVEYTDPTSSARARGIFASLFALLLSAPFVPSLTFVVCLVRVCSRFGGS